MALMSSQAFCIRKSLSKERPLSSVVERVIPDLEPPQGRPFNPGRGQSFAPRTSYCLNETALPRAAACPSRNSAQRL
jgi:hypothetical protein